MAKIARLVTYVVDEKNEYLLNEYLQMARYMSGLKIFPVDYEEKTFDWSDDLVVNQDFCSKDEITKFYRELGGIGNGRNS